MHRWLQFRLRTIFVVVTVCAAMIALLQRTQRLHEAARRHDIERSMAASFAETVKVRMVRHFHGEPITPLPPSVQLRSDQWRALAEHHEQMRDKCLAGRWMPWLSLQSDPPRPPEPNWPKIYR